MCKRGTLCATEQHRNVNPPVEERSLAGARVHPRMQRSTRKTPNGGSACDDAVVIRAGAIDKNGLRDVQIQGKPMGVIAIIGIIALVAIVAIVALVIVRAMESPAKDGRGAEAVPVAIR